MEGAEEGLNDGAIGYGPRDNLGTRVCLATRGRSREELVAVHDFKRPADNLLAVGVPVVAVGGIAACLPLGAGECFALASRPKEDDAFFNKRHGGIERGVGAEWPACCFCAEHGLDRKPLPDL